MSEHTPGPWRVAVDGTHTARHPVILGEPNYYDDGSPREIAQLEHIETDEDGRGLRRTDNAAEVEANARLIAIAPRLLTALEAAVLDHSCDWNGCWHHDAYDAIREAHGEAS